MKPTTQRDLELLSRIAEDLSASLSTQDRHQRFVDAVQAALPVDAVTLMRHEDGVLHPLAQHGLSRDSLGRSFPLATNPRLQQIAGSEAPLVFPHDSIPTLTGQIHACVGCPLRSEEQLEGVLTLDALTPDAFDDISPGFFRALAAIASASLRTALLIEALERNSPHQAQVAFDQVRASGEHLGAESCETKPHKFVPTSPAPRQPLRTGTLRESVASFQRDCVLEALEANAGVWARAAADLGMHRANFHRLAKRMGLKRLR